MLKYVYLRYAEQVSIGDEILAQFKENELTPTKVMNVSNIKLPGKGYS